MMLEKIENKIVSLTKAQAKITQWKSEPVRIVWTNGVFDLLHPGHIRYLCAARALGDYLVVGINSDASVRRLKGPDRPVNPESNRMLQMAALEMIDLVVLFDQDTPLEAILQLKPDIIAKGGDYQQENVVGGVEAAVWGGRVVIIPFESGFSSTGIIERIKKAAE